MAAKGKRPHGQSRGITYIHDRVEEGSKKLGWLAGDVHVLTMHPTGGKSLVCFKVLIGEDAECPGCKRRFGLEDMGFVPLRAEGGRPTCIIVRKDTINFVASIDPGRPVFYGRGLSRFDPVYVTLRAGGVAWAEMFKDTKPNDDMSYWLAQYLKCPHAEGYLVEWFKDELQTPRAVERVGSHEPRELKSGGWVAAAADAALKAELGMSDAEVKAARDRRNADFAKKGKHTTNGKH